MHTASLVPAGS